MTKPGPVLWFTGLSGSGKSTLSEALRSAVREQGISVFQIDGDGLRAGLCRDLGFSPEARDENIRRAAELARLASEQGHLVICSLISPLVAHRTLARSIVGEAFVEVFVDCSVEEAIERDPKGLYKRALNGEIPNFTGISAPYEAPLQPELALATAEFTVDACVEQLLRALAQRA